MSSVDITFLEDKLIPKTWACPHCGKRQKKGPAADEILMGNFKYIQHCSKCGHLHFWKLKLSEGFKRKTVEMLVKP